MLNAILSRQILVFGTGCKKILSADGITSAVLAIKSIQGIAEEISIDVRSYKKSVPAIGDASSIAKNLDEYQFLICSLVSSLSDSNPSKLQLQKYRVAIIAAFAKLSALLRSGAENPGMLLQWNSQSRALLEETSEAYLQAKSNAKLQIVRRAHGAFDYFGVPEAKIEFALKAAYGQEVQD